MIPLAILCDAPGCIRGLVHRPTGFADPCKICLGRGSISLATLCKYLGENESTVGKLLRPHKRMRPRVAARICAKLVAITTSALPKQSELF